MNTATSLEIYELIRDKAEPSYSVNQKEWLSKKYVMECIDKLNDKLLEHKKKSENFERELAKVNMCILVLKELKSHLSNTSAKGRFFTTLQSDNSSPSQERLIHIIPSGLPVALCGKQGRGSSLGILSNCEECLKYSQEIIEKEAKKPMERR